MFKMKMTHLKKSVCALEIDHKVDPKPKDISSKYAAQLFFLFVFFQNLPSCCAEFGFEIPSAGGTCTQIHLCRPADFCWIQM